jgi:two-component system alkaline phosphatase synthesis response regulator PhoP
VRALLRRTDPAPEVESLSGDLMIDLRRRQAFRDSTVLELKPKELELLILLARNRGRAFTREQLLRDVWGYDFFGDSRRVDVHVRWLRQKIEVEPAKPVRLVTVRGTGYRSGDVKTGKSEPFRSSRGVVIRGDWRGAMTWCSAAASSEARWK